MLIAGIVAGLNVLSAKTALAANSTSSNANDW